MLERNRKKKEDKKRLKAGIGSLVAYKNCILLWGGKKKKKKEVVPPDQILEQQQNYSLIYVNYKDSVPNGSEGEAANLGFLKVNLQGIF